MTTLASSVVACRIAMPPASDAAGWCPSIPGHVTDCGVLTRPLVDGAPELGTIEIGYALVHHNGQRPTPAGTLMPNPGGPGLPTIAAGPEVAALTEDVLADYDVLLIDPRGTGVSTPLHCGAIGKGSPEYQRDTAAHCAEELGARAPGYTSAATADDFDAVRAHLGIPTVIGYGSSYGTYLMTVYAQRHPASVQSLVLAGAYPLNFDPLQRPNAEAVDLTLRRICLRSHSCDGEVAVDDLRTVASRLRTAPITVGPWEITEGMLGSLVFEGATSGVGSDPDRMTPLGRLPAALHAAAYGDDDALRAVLSDIAGPADADEDDLFVAVACNDYVTLWSPEADAATREAEYDRALALSGDLGSFSAQGFADAQRDGGSVCIGWPADTNHQRPHDIDVALPSVPVLVLSGDLDAVTPDDNGLRASRQFPNSTFVEVPNVGHTPDNEPSGCVAGIVAEFIRTGATGASTQCLDNIPPIAVEPVGH